MSVVKAKERLGRAQRLLDLETALAILKSSNDDISATFKKSNAYGDETNSTTLDIEALMRNKLIEIFEDEIKLYENMFKAIK